MGRKHTETVKKKYENSWGYKNIHLTNNQEECKRVIEDCPLSFVEGPAGTGKSLTILYSFVREYVRDNTKQILVIRTPVEVGSDKVGFLPSDLKEKIAPHFASTKKILETLLSKGRVENDMSNERIEFKIPNYCLGSTFDNALIFIDEAQELHPTTMKLLLERIGKNSRLVVAGDKTQIYSKDTSRNGLSDAIGRLFDKNMQPEFPEVGYFKFTPKDVVRSDIAQKIVEAYNK